MQSKLNELLWEETRTLSELTEVAKKIVDELLPLQGFCLFLDGSMGAGKTTLSKEIMNRLGMKDTSVVTSPTYAIVNEYQVRDDWYAHLDLYRLQESEDLSELGLEDLHPFKGYLVEWPYAVNDPYPLVPTHLLRIEWINDHERSYKLYK